MGKGAVIKNGAGVHHKVTGLLFFMGEGCVYKADKGVLSLTKLSKC